MAEFTILHLFAGIGGGALGFQQSGASRAGLSGNFRTLAGIDVDPAACRDFERLTGSPAVCMDLFSREDYVAFHGREPSPDWREVTPQDIRAATRGECPDVVFLSPPCKGFSGLLPKKSAASQKYQALNRLTVRGLWYTLEAFGDDPPGLIALENVPRITTRGAHLLRQVVGMLESYGYRVAMASHDCGEIGGLGQRRKRFLLMARLPSKVPAFLYQPPKLALRTIGDIIGPLPMPDAAECGPMHRLPRLKWATWVRLALIPAGGDWRDLQKIAPEEYRLAHEPRKDAFRVLRNDQVAPTVVANARVGGSTGAAIADPRLPSSKGVYSNRYRVSSMDEPAFTVTGDTDIQCGAPSVADKRASKYAGSPGLYGVNDWNQPAPCVTGGAKVTSSNCAAAVADPRLNPASPKFNHSYAVARFDEPSPTVAGGTSPSSGGVCVADARPRNGVAGVQAWDAPGVTVSGALDVHSGAGAVADPRIPAMNDTPEPPPVIIALDGTWHRPLTTLELAALQGFPLRMPDGSPLALDGRNDGRWRERIGNAVPPPAAKAMGEQILKALLAGQEAEFELSTAKVWVAPAEEEYVR